MYCLHFWKHVHNCYSHSMLNDIDNICCTLGESSVENYSLFLLLQQNVLLTSFRSISDISLPLSGRFYIGYIFGH